MAPADGSHSFLNIAQTATSGVRFSGMNDEKPWAISPELQARLNDEYLKAKAAQEAEIEQLISERRWAERREGWAA